MKITKERLRQVIKEELESVLREVSPSTRADRRRIRARHREGDRETARDEGGTSLIQQIINRAYDRLNGRAKDPKTGEPVPLTQKDIEWINVDRVGEGEEAVDIEWINAYRKERGLEPIPIELPEEQEQSP